MDWRGQALIFILSLLASDLTVVTEKAESSPQRRYQSFLLVGVFIINASSFVEILRVWVFYF